MNLRLPFDEPYYIAARYGQKRYDSNGNLSYIHAGEDWNGKGGGNTDLGYKLHAVMPTKIEYINTGESGYGNILVYPVEGPWGQFFVRYCHLQSFDKWPGDVVSPEDVIARLGYSGNSYAYDANGKAIKNAHLHIDLLIKRPPGGNWRLYAPNEGVLKEYFMPFSEWFERYKNFQVQIPSTGEGVSDEVANLPQYFKDAMKEVGLDVTNLQASDEGLVCEMVGHQEDYPVMEKDLESARQAAEEAKATIEDKNSQLHNIRRQLARRDEKVAELTTTIEEKESVIGDLRTKNQELTDSVEQMKAAQPTEAQATTEFPEWGKLLYRYVRVFINTFIAGFSLDVLVTGNSDVIYSTARSALSAALVTTWKALREGKDYDSLLHKLPF